MLPQLDAHVDLILTSPPYDTLRLYGGKPFVFDGLPLLFYRVMKEGGCCVWIVGDESTDGSESGSSFKQAIAFMDAGFKLHDTMIYGKKGFASPSSNRYHQAFEYMFVFSKGVPKTFNPLMDRRNLNDRRGGFTRRQRDGSMKEVKSTLFLNDWGMRYNIWIYEIGKFKVTKDEVAYAHPAIFPEELAADHINSWSNPNDLVLDPFLGSGTVAKMAGLLGRRCIGIETEETYCKIAVNRCRQEVMELDL